MNTSKFQQCPNLHFGAAKAVVLSCFALLTVTLAQALASEATISLGSAVVQSGDNFEIPITVDSGTSPLGAYEGRVRFDPSVLQITGVLGGEREFTSGTLANTNFVGEVALLGYQVYSLTSPTGLIMVARLSFKAIGPLGTSSALVFTQAGVIDTDGITLPLSIVNGSVTIAVFDTDGDGVLNAADACPDTPADSTVDANGCSLDQLVACDGPAPNEPWRNHKEYVRTMRRAAKEFVKADLMTREEFKVLMREVARSQCGRN